MNLLGLLPGVLKAVGKALGIGADVETIVDALDSLPSDKRAELEAALAAQELELRKVDLEGLRALVQEAVAATQSEDKFVRRARPMGLYIAYLITTALAVALIVGIELDTGAVATLILPLFGNAAWYSYNRTKEKMNGHAGT